MREVLAPDAPLRVRSPFGNGVNLGDFSLHESVPLRRFDERRQLLDSLGHGNTLENHGGWSLKLVDQQQRVADILSSTRVRDAFDLQREPENVRYRYGANHFGQSCLLARRLIEAGTRYVQIKWYHVSAFDAWDTHGADLPGMRRIEQQLCPRLDMGLAALLGELHERGLLETTLVVVVGEFGRTPLLNKNGDRDHWPHCFSALFAGAGIPGGTVVGESDAKGAYPASHAFSPADFAATIYKGLGIDTAGDLRIRPYIQSGLPIKDSFNEVFEPQRTPRLFSNLGVPVVHSVDPDIRIMYHIRPVVFCFLMILGAAARAQDVSPAPFKLVFVSNRQHYWYPHLFCTSTTGSRRENFFQHSNTKTSDWNTSPCSRVTERSVISVAKSKARWVKSTLGISRRIKLAI